MSSGTTFALRNQFKFLQQRESLFGWTRSTRYGYIWIISGTSCFVRSLAHTMIIYLITW